MLQDMVGELSGKVQGAGDTFTEMDFCYLSGWSSGLSHKDEHLSHHLRYTVSFGARREVTLS